MRGALIGLGEVLWDTFPDYRRLGGAPANFAYHANALSGSGLVLSRVGNDEDGRQLLNGLREAGLSTKSIQIDPGKATGKVLVKVDEQGVPSFDIVRDVAWDNLQPDAEWLRAAAQADAVCFGTLAQRSQPSRGVIMQVLDAASNALKVFDVNLRQDYYSPEVVSESLSKSHILKLNADELETLGSMLEIDRRASNPAGAILTRYESLRLVCVTLGPHGCLLADRQTEVRCDCPKVKVEDTVGSGDAFTAALVVKQMQGTDLKATGRAANLLGAFVASRQGAMPPLPEELLQQFQSIR